MKNLARLRNDHPSFTHIHTLLGPFTLNENNQKKRLFHGQGLATQELIAPLAAALEGQTSVESAHNFGASEYRVTAPFGHS